MKRSQLASLIRGAECRVFGGEDAGNDAHRVVLAALIRGFNQPEATILCEPSLARMSTRPADAVLVDLVAGVHVIEVKGILLSQVTALEGGGQFRIRYQGVDVGRNPFAQVRNAMFDIKDAVERVCFDTLIVPFRYWVVLAAITRGQWREKWGSDIFCPPELLFQDDLTGLSARLRRCGAEALTHHGLQHWPTDQIQCVWRAFGDSAVLFPLPDERPQRRVRDGTLGDLFDESAETYKVLSDEQQLLSSQAWESGPRLVRGVAGSGKTIVLANNLARRLQRAQAARQTLFESERPPRLAAVCFNRTLVPHVHKKLEVAYRQRTGQTLPEEAAEIWSYNRLMWALAKQGLWRYQHYKADEGDRRARQYLRDLAYVKENDAATFERCCFDAIYVDEGQDFLEDEIRLLKELCRAGPNGEPSLFVFYDDAQNLYGRPRPNWHSIGLNIVGRTHVMCECFRNSRQILEAAFNVLYGTFANDKVRVPTKSFGDIGTLEEKKLLERVDGVWRLHFAKREGMAPRCVIAEAKQQQWQSLIERIRWLTEEQQVRPEDIHVLAYYRNQVQKIAELLKTARLSAIEGVHDATTEKDVLLHRRGWLSVSTVASAKGYDAHCILLAGADEFPTDVQGRASFYVACTRAIEYLEVFAARRTGLAAEMEKAIQALNGENELN